MKTAINKPVPPLKWAGGKRWLIPQITPIWRQHSDRRLVEPFCGGLAIALGLTPKRAWLNDANPHLINFYQCLKLGLYFEDDLENTEECYDEARREFNSRAREGYRKKRDAALFYYLNRTGYNGLCRFNQSGFFNVPYGKYKNPKYIQDFTPYQPLLEPWEFTCGDFSGMAIAPDDFLYADPPYDTPFTQYSAGGFGWEDQIRLAEWLAQHPGPVIASNQATDRIVSLYRGHGFDVQIIEAPRRISCNGDRTPAMEILATRGMA